MTLRPQPLHVHLLLTRGRDAGASMPPGPPCTPTSPSHVNPQTASPKAFFLRQTRFGLPCAPTPPRRGTCKEQWGDVGRPGPNTRCTCKDYQHRVANAETLQVGGGGGCVQREGEHGSARGEGDLWC